MPLKRSLNTPQPRARAIVRGRESLFAASDIQVTMKAGRSVAFVDIKKPLKFKILVLL